MITTRTATAADVTTLAALNAVVHDLHARTRPDIFVTAPAVDALEALLTEQLAEPGVTFVLAETPDGRAVGYAMARVVERPASVLALPETFVSLQQIAVDPTAARGGVGTALLEQVRAIGRAAGCRRLVTQVRDFNEDAYAFYRSAGLSPVTRTLEQAL
ncbi:GNAT family N-acetyltransferase [Streptacidiphilus fuscans]|uniref:GNAT family N-acetyltransferase n=1 Tax=Streptacidiphilus fuscans TaxID=2789292 RepID=A0A931B0G3_9ACTN|nr:GNAT family N-acetyltransferase [Streptacidiphilus fuscans]MBF9066877.1 GNAT family N-acetyltransferase [Streptacidiphilus fuscans]